MACNRPRRPGPIAGVSRVLKLSILIISVAVCILRGKLDPGPAPRTGEGGRRLRWRCALSVRSGTMGALMKAGGWGSLDCDRKAAWVRRRRRGHRCRFRGGPFETPVVGLRGGPSSPRLHPAQKTIAFGLRDPGRVHGPILGRLADCQFPGFDFRRFEFRLSTLFSDRIPDS